MFGAAYDALTALGAHADPLAWGSVALFLAAAAVERADRDRARAVAAAAWATFAAFWLAVFPQFALGMRSFVEGAGSLLAAPACLAVAALLLRGRESLLLPTRAVAFTGLVYLPFVATPLRGPLVESVAAQTNFVVGALGYDPAFVVHEPSGYRSEFVFTTGGERFVTYLVVACTGLGSMAVFAGAIAAVRAPLRRKLRALALALGVIHVLNVARNVFIAVAFGKQWFQVFVPELLTLTGYRQPGLVSYFVADRVVSQTLSVVALVGVAWLVARELPELLTLAEELVAALTGRAVDLGAPAGKPRPDGDPVPAADGD